MEYDFDKINEADIPNSNGSASIRASLDINTIATLMCQRNWLDAAENFG
ncbi:41561_t:CDS:2 [Gigaspora margarita]|uniref:41561_t:CDS:1 n=1 Tax=Gigaspora margarita TaxID=4874 RepID=A0ABN7UK35_GIGMA|nr:41561_t:CDS:2 [Gigaspora margarita]